MKKYSYRLKTAINFINENKTNLFCVKEDIDNFILFLEGMALTASKQSHYEELDEWSKPTYKYVDRMLENAGFVNGNPELNATNIKAKFWWIIYGMLSAITYSSFVVDEHCSQHHISAFNRNAALLTEIKILKEILCK